MFCQKCGSEILDGLEFCGKCGTKITPIVRSNAKKGSGRVVLIIFNILLLLALGFFAVDYFGIIELIPKNTEIESIQSPATTSYELSAAENTAPPSIDEDKIDTEVNIIAATEIQFYGEWILVGAKDYIKDDMQLYDHEYQYVIIDENGLTFGTYAASLSVNYGPNRSLFIYRESGGIDNGSYMYNIEKDLTYMIDKDGRLNVIGYFGEGEYKKTILMYEKQLAGTVENFLNSKGYSLIPGKTIYMPYTDTIYPYFTHICDWEFTDTAENPYIETAYNPDSMFSFDVDLDDVYKSYFVIKPSGNVNFYSNLDGNISLLAEHKYSNELNAHYFLISGDDTGHLSQNAAVFPGGDDRLYVSWIPDGQGIENGTHFYVYDPIVPLGMLDKIDRTADASDFIGVWKGINIFYFVSGTRKADENFTFSLATITPELLTVNKNVILSEGEYDLRAYDNEYFCFGYFLSVPEYYADHDVQVLCFKTIDGQLMTYAHKTEDLDKPYGVYFCFDYFNGTTEECIASFANEQ